MNLAIRLRALRHRDFRLFWTGQALSVMGSWMQTVGQGWLVLELTDSPFKLGLVGALQWGPSLVLSLPAGALADRVSKRGLLLFANAALMVLALLLGWLVQSEAVRYEHVLVLAALYGLVATVEMPTRQSFQYELVERGDLVNAVALNSASFNLARVLGPALAGLTIAHLGLAPTFFLNALSFLPVLAALVLVRSPGVPAFTPEEGEGLLGGMREGLEYARSTPTVWVSLRLLLIMSVAAINHNVLIPVLAREVLHQGAEGYGWLTAALGVGALCGCFAAAGSSRPRPSLLMVVTAAGGLSAICLAMAGVGAMPAALAMLYLMGYCQVRFTVGTNTILQVVTPDRLRGRVLSLYTLVFAGTTPLGNLLAGVAAQALGASAAYALGGVLGLTAVLSLSPGVQIASRLLRRRRLGLRIASKAA